MSVLRFLGGVVFFIFYVWAIISITGSLSSLSKALQELASTKRIATDERELQSIAESLKEIVKHLKSPKE